ncbi:hypothetical protein ACHAXA_009797, partial [Cyclostephanos tholiformis]
TIAFLDHPRGSASVATGGRRALCPRRRSFGDGMMLALDGEKVKSLSRHPSPDNNITGSVRPPRYII